MFMDFQIYISRHSTTFDGFLVAFGITEVSSLGAESCSSLVLGCSSPVLGWIHSEFTPNTSQDVPRYMPGIATAVVPLEMVFWTSSEEVQEVHLPRPKLTGGSWRPRHGGNQTHMCSLPPGRIPWTTRTRTREFRGESGGYSWLDSTRHTAGCYFGRNNYIEWNPY